MAVIKAGCAPWVERSEHPVAAADKCAARRKQKLGDAVGLDQFGVNRVELDPGVWSTVRHWHSHEDEFVMVLSGQLTLVSDDGESLLTPGDCAGFKAGEPNAHRLENRSDKVAVYLEVGSRHPDVDLVYYPDDDLVLGFDAQGRQAFKTAEGKIIKHVE